MMYSTAVRVLILSSSMWMPPAMAWIPSSISLPPMERATICPDFQAFLWAAGNVGAAVTGSNFATTGLDLSAEGTNVGARGLNAADGQLQASDFVRYGLTENKISVEDNSRAVVLVSSDADGVADSLPMPTRCITWPITRGSSA